MFWAPGVSVVEFDRHEPAYRSIFALAQTAQTRVYMVDTFHYSKIRTPFQLLRAVVDSMEIPEWFGYDFAQVFAHKCRSQVQNKHVVGLVLNPQVHYFIDDAEFIHTLSRAHTLSQNQLEFVIFLAPIHLESKV